MEIDNQLTSDAFKLLKKLIKTPSFSKEEGATADLLAEYFRERNIPYSRLDNNIWSRNKYFNKDIPTVLLNSHHDTVRPNKGYTKNPFKAIEEEGKLYGLGSNDAGGALVCLLATFEYFYHRSDLSFNLIFAGTAEEEISGKNGIELLLPKLGEIYLGIVGEPTLMKAAVSEKGLMVIDGVVNGKAGHAAREEGVNAIYKSLDDLVWLRDFKFEKVSPTLGKMKHTVTICNAGSQHNVVPDELIYTIDVRLTDAYSMSEAFEILDKNTNATLKARSMRLSPSSLPQGHEMFQTLKDKGIDMYGSPTLSDQALMPFDTFKMGPGDSARSHTPDEFIFIREIEDGVKGYIELLRAFHNRRRQS